MGRHVCKLCQSCFCCGYCPKFPWVQSSSCTNVVYFFVFILGSFLQWLMYSSIIPTRNFPFCKNEDSLVCQKYSHYFATYRVACSFALFFALMCVCTMGISSSRNIRFMIHNGFWFFKFLFIGLVCYGFSYIPYGWFDILVVHIAMLFLVSFSIFELFLYTGLLKEIGRCCFILCWREASSGTKIFLVFITFPLFFAGLALGAFLYVYYGSCTINITFISVNLTLSYLINIASIGVKYYKNEMYSALKGSVLTTHVMFLTWSAITNNPQQDCNPSESYATSSFRISNLFNVLSIYFGISIGVEYFFREAKKEIPNAVTYVEERGREFCGIWGKRRIVEIVQPPNPESPPQGIVYASTNKYEDEYDHLKYKWYAIHDLYMLGTFYMMFCFTNNYMLDWNTKGITPDYYNYTAMWFKMVATWMCIVIFFLTDLFSKNRSNRMFFAN